MMSLFSLILSQAFAEGVEAAAEHHEVVVPWNSIFVQVFNFTVLFAILFFLLRKSVKHHFAERAQTYKELVDRAENARLEAEKSHTAMKSRLEKLEAMAAQGVDQARAEAAELRTKMMEEAKVLSRRLEHEAMRAAVLELEKAKAELRSELLEKAIATTEEKLKVSLGSSDQKKLQNEFVEKIELVGG